MHGLEGTDPHVAFALGFFVALALKRRSIDGLLNVVFERLGVTPTERHEQRSGRRGGPPSDRTRALSGEKETKSETEK